MAKLLTIISLVLALVLFPPAALAVISNNAVPGDATYPIKRTLEDAIFTVASIHPTSKAWFAAARSDRRFREFTTLVAQGKKTSDTLNELVEQTQIAASQIASVKDESQKEKLVEQLSQSIEKYDQGLAQVINQPIPITTASPTLVPTAQPTIQPTSRPTLVPTPQSTPAPAPDGAGSIPSQDDQARQREIEEARKRLEEIRKRLEEEQRQRLHRQESQSGIRQEGKRENREENEEKTEDRKGESDSPPKKGSEKKDDTKDHSKKNRD